MGLGSVMVITAIGASLRNPYKARAVVRETGGPGCAPGASMNTSASSRSALAMLPILLTVAAVALAAALAAFFPLPLVLLTVGTWPVGLLLLWQTRDIVAPEERIAAVDVERARASASAGTRNAKPLARAA